MPSLAPYGPVFGLWWADAVGALIMLPVIIWQGIEALKEAQEQSTSS